AGAFIAGDATSAGGADATELSPTSRVIGDLRVRGTMNGWGCDNVSGYPCLGGSWNWSNPPEQNVKALGLAGRDPGKVVEIGVIGLPIPVAPTIPAAPPAPSWVDWHYDQ